MRITLDLPEPLFRELKARAAHQGRKLKDLVTAYIGDSLSDAEDAPPLTPHGRSPLPTARRTNDQTIPAMTNVEMRAILDDEDAQQSLQ